MKSRNVNANFSGLKQPLMLQFQLQTIIYVATVCTTIPYKTNIILIVKALICLYYASIASEMNFHAAMPRPSVSLGRQSSYVKFNYKRQLTGKTAKILLIVSL